MTEQDLNMLVSLQKHLGEVFEVEAKTIHSEDFGKIDALGRDLMVTEANAIQTLMGIISVRIGLGMASVQQARKDQAAPADETKPSESEQHAEAPAETTSESEQPVSE